MGIHDYKRINNGYDINHGQRAAEYIDTIRETYLINLSDAQIESLKYACANHTIKHKTGDVTIEFIKVSSYEKKESTGELKIELDLDDDLTGKNLLIIEDIIDTGRTLRYVMDYLASKGAASVEVCALFDKPDRRVMKVEAKYSGFLLPDEFVVGYGLDYAGYYRNLPYLGVLKREVYEG